MNPDDENRRRMPSEEASSARTDGEPVTPVDGGEQTVEGARPGTTDVQAYIGRQLRAVYDDVVKQPIPERFLALMAQLDDTTRG